MLYSICDVAFCVLCLFLIVPRVGLRSVIVKIPVRKQPIKGLYFESENELKLKFL